MGLLGRANFVSSFNILEPDVSDITETSCRITWSAQRLLLPSDYVTYQVEIIRSKEQDLVMVRFCIIDQ